MNCIQLIVVELKSSSGENLSTDEAYNQIKTYKNDILTLFNYNAFCILSDGINAKAGTITSNQERFMNWKSIDGANIESLDVPQYEVMLRGMFEKKAFRYSRELFTIYDALTADDAVKEFINDETLKKIAQELTVSIRNNITIDWSVRKSSQAGMRKIIERLLKKYDYLPSEAKKALETVMRQAELMCENVDMDELALDIVAEEKGEYEV